MLMRADLKFWTTPDAHQLTITLAHSRRTRFSWPFLPSYVSRSKESSM